MQRNLAGIFFLVAGVMVSIALGAWWLQRTSFTPEATPGRTAAVLDDDQVRAEITTVVTAATSLTLGDPPNGWTSWSTFIDEVIGSRPGAGVMVDIVSDAHAKVIGNHDEPVRISGAQMVEIVRDQAVGELEPVTLPVAEVTTLRFLGNVLGWFAAVTMIIGALAFLLGVIVRPERGEVGRALGEFLCALGASLVLFGVLLPVFIIPAINDSTWMAVVPRLAMRTLPFVLVASLVLALAGVFVITKSTSGGKRKQWSTPLAVGRYREDRSWS